MIAYSAITEHDTITVSAHRRKRVGRKPLPPELERIDIVHELSEAQQFCPQDGAQLRPFAQSYMRMGSGVRLLLGTLLVATLNRHELRKSVSYIRREPAGSGRP